jgi:hypothetical protein
MASEIAVPIIISSLLIATLHWLIRRVVMTAEIRQGGKLGGNQEIKGTGPQQTTQPGQWCDDAALILAAPPVSIRPQATMITGLSTDFWFRLGDKALAPERWLETRLN